MDIEKADEDLFLIHLSKRIRSLRETRDLTLQEVEAQGWSCWQQLQRLETAGQNVRIGTLRKVAKFYGIKLSELFLELD